MKKTTTQLRDEFIEIMTSNGFEATGEATCDGSAIFAREWVKTSDVVWYGSMTSTMKITAHISFGCPIINIYHNGRREEGRDYSSPKRAINAIKEIIRCAGYEF